MSKLCQQCQHALAPEDQFCDRCGGPVRDLKASSPRLLIGLSLLLGSLGILLVALAWSAWRRPLSPPTPVSVSSEENPSPSPAGPTSEPAPPPTPASFTLEGAWTNDGGELMSFKQEEQEVVGRHPGGELRLRLTRPGGRAFHGSYTLEGSPSIPASAELSEDGILHLVLSPPESEPEIVELKRVDGLEPIP